MTTNIHWTKGETLLIQDDEYVVHTIERSGHVKLHVPADRMFVTKSQDELLHLWERGDLTRLRDPQKKLSEPVRMLLECDYSGLDEETKSGAERRQAYLNGILNHRIRRRLSKTIVQCIADVAKARGETPPDRRTINRWIAQCKDVEVPGHRDIRTVAPRIKARGNRTPRFPWEVEDVLCDVIEDFVLVSEPNSGPEVYDLIEDRLRKANEGRDKLLPIPSLRTVQRYIASIPDDILVTAQEGPLQAERQCQPVLAAPKATRPMEVVEIDHTVLDLILLDEDGQVIGRPCITVAIDRYTRMIVGLNIGFLDPGYSTVMACLRSIILPKTWLNRKYPDRPWDWPCHGIPTIIVVDNGPEFHSKSFKEACLQLNIGVHYCPTKKPRYKGKVERFFGRLNSQLIHQLPGTTFSNPQKRGDYKSAKKAVLTLESLAYYVLRWIVEDYSHTPHRGIADVPYRRWQEGVKKHPVTLPTSVKDLDILIAHVAQQKLTRNGIEMLGGLAYTSNAPIIKTLLNDPELPKTSKVKYDPDDLSKIWLEDHRDGTYVQLDSKDPEYTRGLTLAQHNIIKARAKLSVRKYKRLTIANLMASREEIRAHVREMRRLGKMSKRLAKLFNRDPETYAEQAEPKTQRHRVTKPTRPTKSTPVLPKTAPPQQIAEEEEDDEAFERRIAELGVG